MPVPTAISCHRISALLLPLFVLGLPLPLGPSPFRTFKQSLPDEPWLYVSINIIKPLPSFSAFSVLNLDDNNSFYNLTDNNKCKPGFDTAFINSRPLASNYD